MVIQRFVHDLDRNKHLLRCIVIPAYILRLSFVDERLFDGNQAKHANQYSDGIIEDVGGKVPKAFVRCAIFVGEGY